RKREGADELCPLTHAIRWNHRPHVVASAEWHVSGGRVHLPLLFFARACWYSEQQLDPQNSSDAPAMTETPTPQRARSVPTFTEQLRFAPATVALIAINVALFVVMVISAAVGKPFSLAP